MFESLETDFHSLKRYLNIGYWLKANSNVSQATLNDSKQAQMTCERLDHWLEPNLIISQLLKTNLNDLQPISNDHPIQFIKESKMISDYSI